jgi:hypothetical protein
VPALLTTYNVFQPAEMERVIKDKAGGLKAYPVFFWFDRFLASSQENTCNSLTVTTIV